MKKLTHLFWAKSVAVFLWTLCALGAAAGFVIAAYAVSMRGRTTDYLEGWLANLSRLSNTQINALTVLGAVLTLAFAALTIFLFCAAARREGVGEPVRSRLDRVPFDLLLALSFGAFVFLFSLLRQLSYFFQTAILLLPLALILAAGLLLALMLGVTFAARVKTGTLWRNNVSSYVLVFLWRVAAKIIKNLSLLWKAILAYAAFGLACIWMYGSARFGGFATLLFLLLVLGGLAALCLAALQMQRLEKGAKALAAGDLSYRVDTKGMILNIRAHGEALNGIGDGMRRAVEERMKSERMKTDLIANVSHDLKTPLTSIVSYVDLLQKEELENEAARGYVEVLARQAERLKKLTGDIVEASKASSGAIPVSPEPTDLKEILHQGLAEYGERLGAAGIEPVVRLADPLPPILADGKLCWRVLDNLLNNACKYALSGTRLYCDAAQEGEHVILTLRNVSREPIGVSAAELTERFVRGDAARSSEGSGLGLSIAKSLMELQNGALLLDADGDLFKARVVFKRAN